MRQLEGPMYIHILLSIVFVIIMTHQTSYAAKIVDVRSFVLEKLPSDVYTVNSDGTYTLIYPEKDGRERTLRMPHNILDLPVEKMEASLNRWLLKNYPEKVKPPKSKNISEREVLEREALMALHQALQVSSSQITETWLTDEHVCEWEFISCSGISGIPTDSVTHINIENVLVFGTLPSEIGELKYLQHLRISGCRLRGTIPTEITSLGSLSLLELSFNELTGTIPPELGIKMKKLWSLFLNNNFLEGTIPKEQSAWSKLSWMDLSSNNLAGTIPEEIFNLSALQVLIVSDNLLEGPFPSNVEGLVNLNVLDASRNAFGGLIPTQLGLLSNLLDLDLTDCSFTGTFPTEFLSMANLQNLILSYNLLSGSLPAGDDSGDVGRQSSAARWSTLSDMVSLQIDHNEMTGVIPSALYEGLRSSLRLLDVSFNNFNGTIATALGSMSSLHTIDIMCNQLTGTIPNEMLKMNPNLRLNLTGNLLTGTIPGMFCGEGSASVNMLYREFGCDAVLCPPGTFSIFGHATLYSACRPCPPTQIGEMQSPPESKVLGRVSCPGQTFIYGDLNGDGVLAPREILRMMYVDTLGRFWGAAFQNWVDMSFHECELEGITCVKGEIVKIDLTSANMCSDGDRGPGPEKFCKGIPPEIGHLSGLEVLLVSRRQFLRGTIPKDIGRLTNLQFLDLSSSAMSGTIPTEIGLLSNLKVLALSHSRFRGSIPSELFNLKSLEKLHLTNNLFDDFLPTNITLRKCKEFMLSRNQFIGALPTTIGRMTVLENLEVYGNTFGGTVPTELEKCTKLKRIDLFNNHFTGPLPEIFGVLEYLQILHLKQNHFTGTIPIILGDLKYLSWIDLSDNRLHGVIPSSFGGSRYIKDFRVADNMIHDPIPRGLCTNPNVNNGATKLYGCDGVLCPLGTYSESGFAVEKQGGCKKCPEGETTLYLGSTKCRKLTEKEILSIFFDVMQGDKWNLDHRQNWQDPDFDVCFWSGVTCDQNGDIVSIGFPLVGVDELY